MAPQKIKYIWIFRLRDPHPLYWKPLPRHTSSWRLTATCFTPAMASGLLPGSPDGTSNIFKCEKCHAVPWHPVSNHTLPRKLRHLSNNRAEQRFTTQSLSGCVAWPPHTCATYGVGCRAIAPWSSAYQQVGVLHYFIYMYTSTKMSL